MSMPAPRLAHNVFFKLKDRSPAKADELVKACQKYLNIQPGILFFAVGVIDASLAREVNDCDWDVGLHLVFVDRAAHDLYQVDPTHQMFIDEQKSQWAAVRVFDSLV
jgi:hypothetical protein